MSEIFAHHKEHSQRKRANNRAKSAQILTDAGVQFEVKNDGAHLIVVHDGVTVDFWPGTGKFIFRSDKSRTQRHGVFNLLDALGVERP